MLISSSDLLGTAYVQAGSVYDTLKRLHNEQSSPEIVQNLDEVLDEVLQVAAEIVVARHGVLRRMPQFEPSESDQRIDVLKRSLAVICRESLQCSFRPRTVETDLLEDR